MAGLVPAGPEWQCTLDQVAQKKADLITVEVNLPQRQRPLRHPEVRAKHLRVTEQR
jgi:hypothetical protein